MSKDVQPKPKESPAPQPVTQPESASNPPAKDELRFIQGQAFELFDRTGQLHELGDKSREVLAYAVKLHRLPLPRLRRKPLKAAKELIKAHSPDHLSADERNVLAVVVALQQGKIKRKDISNLYLSPMQQREALTIAALLKVAVALDDSHSQSTTISHVEADRSGVWVVVNGPNAMSDAAAAQDAARMWGRIGYPNITLLLPEEAQTKLHPFPEPMKRPGVEATDPLAEAARKVMRFHFAEMLRNEEGTRLGEDIEALHDMRVATRRLRAAFEVFGSAFEPGMLKPHLKGLRLTGRSLGTVRDLDVFMETAQGFIETLPDEQKPGMDLLLSSWRAQREKTRAEMLTFLDSQDYHSFKRQFNNFLATPGAGALKIPLEQPTPTLVREQAPGMIYSRLASVRAFEPYLEDAPLERLHLLRIEFKKLRYTVEYFREVLGKETEEIIDILKKLQDHLGELNDANVAAQILRQFITEHTAKGEKLTTQDQQGLEAIALYLSSRLEELDRLKATFPETWELFNNPQFRRDLARAISVL